MKRCPYCAEEIQDVAVRCRYCRSDATPDLLPLPAAVLREDAEVVRSGRRFAIGVQEGEYVVWDLLIPEGPVERFSGDGSGLDEALSSYRRRERASRGPARWLRPAGIAFAIGLAGWVITGAAYGFIVGRQDFTSLSSVLALHSLFFGVWVGSLAIVAFSWLSGSLRSRG